MAILLIDGADHYNDETEMIRKGWVFSKDVLTDTVNFYTGRFGGTGFVSRNGTNVNPHNFNLAKLISQTTDTIYIGAAVYVNYYSASHTHWIGFLESGTSQIGVRINTDLTVSVVVGGRTGTVIGTSSAANKVAYLGWTHLSGEFFLNGSTGTAKVWINGVLVINLTNVDTLQTANAYADAVSIQLVAYPNNTGALYVIILDDLYAGDDSGSFNTTCPGDRRVATLYPTGNGATADWTASAGSDYECVDETAPDDDTTYVSSSTVDQEELFTFPDLPANANTVNAVQLVSYSRKDDASDRAIIPIIRSNGANYEEGSDRYLASTYAFFTQIVEDDPDDSAAWTPAKVNAAEFGVKVAV